MIFSVRILAPPLIETQLFKMSLSSQKAGIIQIQSNNLAIRDLRSKLTNKKPIQMVEVQNPPTILDIGKSFNTDKKTQIKARDLCLASNDMQSGLYMGTLGMVF